MRLLPLTGFKRKRTVDVFTSNGSCSFEPRPGLTCPVQKDCTFAERSRAWLAGVTSSLGNMGF